MLLESYGLYSVSGGNSSETRFYCDACQRLGRTSGEALRRITQRSQELAKEVEHYGRMLAHQRPEESDA